MVPPFLAPVCTVSCRTTLPDPLKRSPRRVALGDLNLKSKLEIEEQLLVIVKRFGGIAARVAAKLNVDPSFVSRVVHGQRKSPEIISALLGELKSIRNALNEAIIED
jgi:hypothetical protein